MEDKISKIKYLDVLVENALSSLSERHPMHRRRLLAKQIALLNQKKQMKCPKSSDPQICKAKYDQKIASKKEKLRKLSNLILSSPSAQSTERSEKALNT